MQPLDGGKVGAGRLLALQAIEDVRRQSLLDGAQAVGALGVTLARIVLEAGGMGEEKRGHARPW